MPCVAFVLGAVPAAAASLATPPGTMGGLLASRMLFADPSTSSITHNPDSRKERDWGGDWQERLRRSLRVWLRLMFGGAGGGGRADGLIEGTDISFSDDSDDEGGGGGGGGGVAAVAVHCTTARSQRLRVYMLLSSQHLCNYMSRLAIPFLVPFIVRHNGFSHVETARLLSSFIPGYVLTMFPGGYATKRLGSKAVIVVNGVLTSAALLALPAAGRAGAWTTCIVLAALGVAQGPYQSAAAVSCRSIIAPATRVTSQTAVAWPN